MIGKLIIAAGVAIVLSFLIFTLGYAELPGVGWWTAQQIQAVEDGTKIRLVAYEETSPPEHLCGTVNLDAKEAFVFVPTDQFGSDFIPNCSNLPEGFRGSAIVQSNKPIFGIVEQTNQLSANLGVQGGTADASYRATGRGNASTVLRFPTYKNDHADETTTFYIQNAGDTFTTLRAVFQECNSATTPECNGSGVTYLYTLTTPIAPNQMAIIMPADAKDSSGGNMPSGYGYFGGLTIESVDNQLLAGVVNEHRTVTEGPARYLKSTRAFVPADYDNQLYAPAIKKTYPAKMDGSLIMGVDELTKWSALVIQNAGNVLGDFTITYTVATNEQFPEREGLEVVDSTTCRNIVPGETCFVMTLFPVEGSGTEQLLDDEYVAAKVTGNVPMVAVVNEETIYTHTPDSEKQFATYSTIPDKDKSHWVSIPSYKEEWVNRYMGVVVQNVGSDLAVVTATVRAINAPGELPSEDLVAQKMDLIPNSAVTFFLLSKEQAQIFQGVDVIAGVIGEYEGINGGMMIEANQPVAVLINQENSYLTPPSTRLDAANYEGFPLSLSK